MDAVSSSVEVDASPEVVYAYAADLSHFPEWAKPLIGDVHRKELAQQTSTHLTREDPIGRGAGIRFAVGQRSQRYPWMDLTIVEADPGERLVLAGRGGKFNRVRSVTDLRLEPLDGGRRTRATLSYASRTKLPTDRLFDRKAYFKRAWARSLKRLAKVAPEGARDTPPLGVAGGPRKPASGFHFGEPTPVRGR